MKKIFCFSLTSFLLIFSYISPVSAAAGDIIIGGDPVGTGGLFDGSFVGQAGIASIFAFLGLKAAQIDVHLTEDYIESGGTHVQFVQDKLNEWADGSPWFQTLLQGVRIAEDGVIYYQQAALDIIKQFGNWVTGADSEVFYDGDINDIPVDDVITSVVGGSVPSVQLLGGETLETVSAAQYVTVSANLNTAGEPVYLCQYDEGNGYYSYLILAKHSFDFYLTWKKTSDNSVYTAIHFSKTRKTGEWWYYMTSPLLESAARHLKDVPTITKPAEGVATMVGNLNGDVAVEGGASDLPNTFWGDREGWSDFVGGLSLPDGYMGAIDTGILDQIQGELDQTKEYVLDLQDYIKALEDSLNEQAVTDIPIQDTQNGVIELIPDIPFETQPEYEQVAPEDLPAEDQTLPIVDPAILADPADIISSNTLDLTDVFPFCIPFDIYDILQKFKTAPVTPQYRVQFHIPLVDVDVDYLIDFSMFDTTAQILRVMELIALVVALAVATRAIYLRS